LSCVREIYQHLRDIGNSDGTSGTKWRDIRNVFFGTSGTEWRDIRNATKL
jgi:hypothetical protein